MPHQDALISMHHASHSVVLSDHKHLDDDDGFDAWNETAVDPAFSTMNNLVDASESSNIVSESADTDKSSLPDLGNELKQEVKTALLAPGPSLGNFNHVSLSANVSSQSVSHAEALESVAKNASDSSKSDDGFDNWA